MTEHPPHTLPETATMDFRYDKERKTLIPARTGYYWAKWRIAADGTHEGDDLTPSMTWEIVQVNDNNVNDPEDDEHLSVSVPGVRETQWRENFVWGARVGPLKDNRDPAQQVPTPSREALVQKIATALADGKDSGGYDTLLEMYAHIALTVIERTSPQPATAKQADAK